MAFIPPHYFDTVVAIGIKNNGGKYVWIATGFLVGRLYEKKSGYYGIFVVTNKHVLDDTETIYLRFNPESPDQSKIFPINLVDESGNCIWTGHQDSEIDVAAIHIDPTKLNEFGIKYSYFRSDKEILTKKQMIKGGMTEGDSIYVLGFPLGIVGISRNYVISRSGIIARIKEYFENHSTYFLIDSSVFPGNSGGPVINKPEIHGIEKTGIVQNSFLIGMVQQYIPYYDKAISEQTNNVRVFFVENSGLAAIIPTNYILETLDDANSKLNPKE
jgi:S1-C subfamily serine protease